MVDFGDRLRAIRIKRGMSQSQLAKKIRVTSGAVSSYENSTRRPSYEVLVRIARCFDVSTDYLLGLEKPLLLDLSVLTSKQRNIVNELMDEFIGNG
ncbi:MAG: helix-turn-helix transcriptional regulator [Clostridia bacterium]|nr:helix-turn-helix transcriptional regulator [Clostridia bacterium]MBQ6703797.1 helix-turn-helix transcriptional regulator [Clostridia bacterium]